MLLLFMLTSVCGAGHVRLDLVMSSGRSFGVTRGSRVVCGVQCEEDAKCKGFSYDDNKKTCHMMEEGCQESHYMYVLNRHPYPTG